MGDSSNIRDAATRRLQQTEAYLGEMGITPKVGIELEFMLYDQNGNLPAEKEQKKIAHQLSKLAQEQFPGQAGRVHFENTGFEFVTKPLSPVAAADTIEDFKTFISQNASRVGMSTALFDARQCGQNIAIHNNISLWDEATRTNLFHDPSRGLSDLARHSVDGLIDAHTTTPTAYFPDEASFDRPNSVNQKGREFKPDRMSGSPNFAGHWGNRGMEGYHGSLNELDRSTKRLYTPQPQGSVSSHYPLLSTKLTLGITDKFISLFRGQTRENPHGFETPSQVRVESRVASANTSAHAALAADLAGIEHSLRNNTHVLGPGEAPPAGTANTVSIGDKSVAVKVHNGTHPLYPLATNLSEARASASTPQAKALLGEELQSALDQHADDAIRQGENFTTTLQGKLHDWHKPTSAFSRAANKVPIFGTLFTTAFVVNNNGFHNRACAQAAEMATNGELSQEAFEAYEKLNETSAGVHNSTIVAGMISPLATLASALMMENEIGNAYTDWANTHAPNLTNEQYNALRLGMFNSDSPQHKLIDTISDRLPADPQQVPPELAPLASAKLQMQQAQARLSRTQLNALDDVGRYPGASLHTQYLPTEEHSPERITALRAELHIAENAYRSQLADKFSDPETARQLLAYAPLDRKTDYASALAASEPSAENFRQSFPVIAEYTANEEIASSLAKASIWSNIGAMGAPIDISGELDKHIGQNSQHKARAAEDTIRQIPSLVDDYIIARTTAQSEAETPNIDMQPVATAETKLDTTLTSPQTATTEPEQPAPEEQAAPPRPAIRRPSPSMGM